VWWDSRLYSHPTSTRFIEVLIGEVPWGPSMPESVVKCDVTHQKMLPQRPTHTRFQDWALVTRIAATSQTRGSPRVLCRRQKIVHCLPFLILHVNAVVTAQDRIKGILSCDSSLHHLASEADAREARYLHNGVADTLEPILVATFPQSGRFLSSHRQSAHNLLGRSPPYNHETPIYIPIYRL